MRKMKLFSIFRRKKRKEWTPEEAEEAMKRSLELRQQQAEMRRAQFDLKMAEIKSETAKTREMAADLLLPKGSSGSTEDKLLMMLLEKVLSQPKTTQSAAGDGWDYVSPTPLPAAAAPPFPPATPQTPQSTAAGSKLSNEEIKGLLAQVPQQYLSMAKNMPEKTIKDFLRGQAGNYDDDTLNRAVAIIKGKI
jgi:hypothetical protein